MNVIFLDFDGVFNTLYEINYRLILSSEEDTEIRVKILSDICHKYNAKVVIESSHKIFIDDKLESNVGWIQNILDLFEKYDIECIGITPSVKKYRSNDKSFYTSVWKEDEIRLYLYRHLEIDHYAIIDDDDLGCGNTKSDLDKVRKHLVKTEYITSNPAEAGLLPKHIDEVGEVLKLDNDVKKLILKRKNRI